MAFKKFSNYIEEKNGQFFVLRNDGDFADVVFLYRSYDDMLVCDAHYLSTNGYKGYVECCADEYGRCPACSYGDKGIQKQTKLFIPLFNLTKGTLEFWDRNTSFESVINDSVFKNYPNPSEFVFRVTRHGQPRDVNTKYEITAQGRNSGYPYEKILADYGITLPEGYSEVCRSMTPEEMSGHLNNHGSASDLSDYSYTPVPRGSAPVPDSNDIPEPPEIDVPTTEFSAPPTDLPEIDIPQPGAAQTPVDTAPDTPVADTPTDDLDNVSF